jgi:two-component system response regulator NreC
MVSLIERAIAVLDIDELDEHLRGRAQRSAHMLNGSLGMFGYARASEAARELEQELAQAPQARAPALSTLVAVVRQCVSPAAALSSRPTGIVLADDHAVVRGGLRLLLENEPDFEVLAEAGDAESARRYVRGHHPRVLVLDLNMPGGSGLDTIPRIRAESPATHVVVLTAHREPALARQALDAGALGYVLKDAANDELVRAVRAAAAGESFLDPRIGALLAAEPSAKPPNGLSEREVGVLVLIALGHTNAEIAEQLYLSVRTIESHRLHIQRKLQIFTRAELVRYARERGLIEL